ncbi:MAG: acetylglutamate kinase, partial [Calditrichia bacterium]|nr:acetylglutamate kinase [Calditrichia bacterium]
TNADTIASELGAALSQSFEVSLIYSFEKNGVLTDVNDEKSKIAHITPNDYDRLKNENIIADGMIPKIDNAFFALRKGVKNVFITHFNSINNQKQLGTKISFE